MLSKVGARIKMECVRRRYRKLIINLLLKVIVTNWTSDNLVFGNGNGRGYSISSLSNKSKKGVKKLYIVAI